MHIKWTLPQQTFELTSGSQKYEGKRISPGLFTSVPVDKAGDAWAGSMLWGTDGVITIHRSGRYSMHICPNRYGYEMKTPALRWVIETVTRKENGSQTTCEKEYRFKISERSLRLERLLVGRSPVDASVFKNGYIGTLQDSASTYWEEDRHLATILTTATHLFCAQMVSYVEAMPDMQRDVFCHSRGPEKFFLELPIFGPHCGNMPQEGAEDELEIVIWDREAEDLTVALTDQRVSRGKITIRKKEVQLELNRAGDKILLQPILVETETYFKVSPNIAESTITYLKPDGDSWRLYNPVPKGNSLKFIQIRLNNTEARNPPPNIGCFWDSMPYLEYAGLLMVTTHVLDKELRYILAIARTGRVAGERVK
ncbi:hypothetical protein C8R43DRAFT_954637 [Mycena crocata]|nr:hypothetical protein C8R43DRAFT_954637 [Mycena crocata]